MPCQKIVLQGFMPRSCGFLGLGYFVIVIFSTRSLMSSAVTPVPAKFFDKQCVNHDDDCDEMWSQRYYTLEDHFRGPGSPIFMILGGEGAMEPQSGIYYDLISNLYAPNFGAFILQPEHRFYGKSQPPLDKYDRLTLLTPKQALQDYMHLVKLYQTKLGCSANKSSSKYCPVITVGGSYPGWLSAMARLLFPDVVDMAYSGSAPMKFYAQQVHPGDYYDHITFVAEKSMKGCSQNVRSTLELLNDFMLHQLNGREDFERAALSLGFCPNSAPQYMMKLNDVFAEEINMIIAYTFANDNMANYPPNTQTRLHHACEIFADADKGYLEKVESFIRFHLGNREGTASSNDDDSCADMSKQLPTGPNATISGGDWSGDGNGPAGESWDFQTCTLLVEQIGMSENSMFPSRKWSFDWMKRHCQERFGVSPKPYKLAREWGFDDLLHRSNATRIVFTNGLNDGWSVGGIQDDLSDDLIAVNFPNGAHHSELAFRGVDGPDTDDVKLGVQRIQKIFQDWLSDFRGVAAL